MLDSLRTGKAQKQVDDLQSLIAAAKEERSALSAMLTQISMRSSKLSQMGNSLEHIEQQAVAAADKLDDVTRRLKGVEDRAATFSDLERRVKALIDTAMQAQAFAETLMGPEGELEAHRRQVEQLSSQALETQASIDAIKKERAGFEEFRSQLRLTQDEIESSVDNAAMLRGELDHVRGTAGQLSQDYATLRETVRAAREDSNAATEAVKDVEKKLGPLMQLQESQALETQASIDAIKKERVGLEEFRSQLRLAQGEITSSVDNAAMLRGEFDQVRGALDQVRGTADQLSQDYATLRETVRAAREDSNAATEAVKDVEKKLGPLMQLQESQALKTQASIDAIEKERAGLEEFRSQLRLAQGEITSSVDNAAMLRGELDQVRGALDQVRGTAGQLSQDYATLRETVRAAREDSNAATEAVKDVEKKLGPLMQLQELSKSTDEKLTSLNALAEHVTQKAKALEAQKHTIDRAVVEASRLNEMVWGMDVQIGKLNEGLKQAARGEETIDRMERLVEETTSKVESASNARDEFSREAARMEKDSRALVDAMRSHVEKLSLEKKDFEAYDQRVRGLQTAVAEAEGRMDAMSAMEKHLSLLSQRADELSKELQTLVSQSDDLAIKQANLESLQERLEQMDELARRTVVGYETLEHTRTDLDALRKELEDFHKAYAEAAQLGDTLSADRDALEAFGDRLTSFRARTPELEVTMSAILGRLGEIETGTKAATRLGELASDLDAQLVRVTGRIQFVDKLEGRINTLHVLTADVDRKLAEQLARRAELDTMKTEHEGVLTQMLDVQRKVEAVATAQNKVLPLHNGLVTLQAQLDKARASYADVVQEDATIKEQQARLVELIESSRTLATETAERMKQMQALTEELARSGAAKDELIAELSRVQARQRDAVAQAEATEDQVKRAEAMYKALEQRRAQLLFSEKKIAAVELKFADLTQRSAEIDQKIKSLVDREAIVSAVKAEVDSVHQISARSKADLAYVSDRREEIAELRRQVQELLSKAGDTEEKIATIDMRRGMVEEVQAKTSLISNLLEDVHVNLETLGEQKAVIDHIGEKLARLEFIMQEAQNTLHKLQHERELAERIEQSIKQLRTRTAKSDDITVKKVTA